jgi:GrpB-like predicted nucleotidyltransferase (UPF0157 family)
MSETTPRPGWDTDDWSNLPPTTIHAPDPTWPDQYRQAEREIADALSGLDVRIDHVGSTAVPGLAARRGIDILIGLADRVDAEAVVARLLPLGYEHHFSRPDWTHLSGRGRKLHLTPVGAPMRAELLLFRDYLRAHPEAAAAYAQLKRELARAHGPDGRRYVEGKTAFVRQIVARARTSSEATQPGP